MKAVLYFNKPIGSGAIFPISIPDIASVRCLENATGIRGPQTKRAPCKIKNIEIIADAHLNRFTSERLETFDSFEDFLWSFCGPLRLTFNF
jgi:hypothetical protein